MYTPLATFHGRRRIPTRTRASQRPCIRFTPRRTSYSDEEAQASSHSVGHDSVVQSSVSRGGAKPTQVGSQMKCQSESNVVISTTVDIPRSACTTSNSCKPGATVTLSNCVGCETGGALGALTERHLHSGPMGDIGDSALDKEVCGDCVVLAAIKSSNGTSRGSSCQNEDGGQAASSSTLGPCRTAECDLSLSTLSTSSPLGTARRALLDKDTRCFICPANWERPAHPDPCSSSSNQQCHDKNVGETDGSGHATRCSLSENNISPDQLSPPSMPPSRKLPTCSFRSQSSWPAPPRCGLGYKTVPSLDEVEVQMVQAAYNKYVRHALSDTHALQRLLRTLDPSARSSAQRMRRLSECIGAPVRTCMRNGTNGAPKVTLKVALQYATDVKCGRLYGSIPPVVVAHGCSPRAKRARKSESSASSYMTGSVSTRHLRPSSAVRRCRASGASCDHVLRDPTSLGVTVAHKPTRPRTTASATPRTRPGFNWRRQRPSSVTRSIHSVVCSARGSVCSGRLAAGKSRSCLSAAKYPQRRRGSSSLRTTATPPPVVPSPLRSDTRGLPRLSLPREQVDWVRGMVERTYADLGGLCGADGRRVVRIADFLRALEPFQLSIDLRPYQGIEIDPGLTGALTLDEFLWIWEQALQHPSSGPYFTVMPTESGVGGVCDGSVNSSTISCSADRFGSVIGSRHSLPNSVLGSPRSSFSSCVPREVGRSSTPSSNGSHRLRVDTEYPLVTATSPMTDLCRMVRGLLLEEARHTGLAHSPTPPSSLALEGRRRPKRRSHSAGWQCAAFSPNAGYAAVMDGSVPDKFRSTSSLLHRRGRFPLFRQPRAKCLSPATLRNESMPYRSDLARQWIAMSPYYSAAYLQEVLVLRPRLRNLSYRSGYLPSESNSSCTHPACVSNATPTGTHSCGLPSRSEKTRVCTRQTGSVKNTNRRLRSASNVSNASSFIPPHGCVSHGAGSIAGNGTASTACHSFTTSHSKPQESNRRGLTTSIATSPSRRCSLVVGRMTSPTRHPEKCSSEPATPHASCIAQIPHGSPRLLRRELRLLLGRKAQLVDQLQRHTLSFGLHEESTTLLHEQEALQATQRALSDIIDSITSHLLALSAYKKCKTHGCNLSASTAESSSSTSSGSTDATTLPTPTKAVHAVEPRGGVVVPVGMPSTLGLKDAVGSCVSQLTPAVDDASTCREVPLPTPPVAQPPGGEHCPVQSASERSSDLHGFSIPPMSCDPRNEVSAISPSDSTEFNDRCFSLERAIQAVDDFSRSVGSGTGTQRKSTLRSIGLHNLNSTSAGARGRRQECEKSDASWDFASERAGGSPSAAGTSLPPDGHFGLPGHLRANQCGSEKEGKFVVPVRDGPSYLATVFLDCLLAAKLKQKSITQVSAGDCANDREGDGNSGSGDARCQSTQPVTTRVRPGPTGTSGIKVERSLSPQTFASTAGSKRRSETSTTFTLSSTFTTGSHVAESGLPLTPPLDCLLCVESDLSFRAENTELWSSSVAD